MEAITLKGASRELSRSTRLMNVSLSPNLLSRRAQVWRSCSGRTDKRAPGGRRRFCKWVMMTVTRSDAARRPRHQQRMEWSAIVNVMRNQAQIIIMRKGAIPSAIRAQHDMSALLIPQNNNRLLAAGWLQVDLN